MYPVSDEFLRAVKRSHTIAAKVEVYDGSTLAETLRVSGGNVSLDRDNANRRRCNVRIDGADYTPRLISDLLHPSAGHELKMYRGVVTGYESYDDSYTVYSGRSWRDTVMQLDPIGFWRLGESSQTEPAKDVTANGDGDYQAGWVYNEPGALPYDSNTAIKAPDGTIRYVYVTNNGRFNGIGQRFALGCWIRRDAEFTGYAYHPFHLGNSTDGSPFYLYCFGNYNGNGNDGRLGLYATRNGSWGAITSNVTVIPADGIWRFVVAQYDSTDSSKGGIWVDGTKTAIQSTTGPTDDALTTNSLGFNQALGATDERFIVDRTLTQDEIDTLYTRSRTQYKTTVQRTSQREIIEYVPLGVFNIEDTDLEDTGEEIKITVKGFDRSKDIQRRRFTDIYTVVRGTKYTDAIRNMIDSVYPGLTYNFPNIDYVTPQLVFGEGAWGGGGDRWDKALDMAQSIGHELFFDPQGALELRPEPDASNDPVDVEYKEGPESVLLYVTRDISREDMFNHVIAIGNHSDLDQPIRADAQDNDPNSPTYVGGPFGDVPTWIRSTMIRTQEQAQEVADAQLRRKLGTPERIRFISIVNPAHDIGDVVRVERYSIGVQSTHVLDSFNIPLDYTGSINATARERRM